MFRYETHCHCSQCSACGHSTSAEIVRAYHAAGYAGLVLTDHFIRGNTAVDRSLPWDTKVRLYYDAYLEAKAVGDQLDFDVIFGIEDHFGGGHEVLLYNIDLDFLLANPDMCDIPLEELIQRVHAWGGLVFQAHPYRKRRYIDETLPPRDDIVDGLFIEFKNRLIHIVSTEQSDGEMYIDLLMIAKYYERIADHATNIAEWVLYSITGKKVSNDGDL